MQAFLAALCFGHAVIVIEMPIFSTGRHLNPCCPGGPTRRPHIRCCFVFSCRVMNLTRICLLALGASRLSGRFRSCPDTASMVFSDRRLPELTYCGRAKVARAVFRNLGRLWVDAVEKVRGMLRTAEQSN